MGGFAFRARGEGTKTLELDVFSVIGDDWFYDSISAASVRRLLKGNADATLIRVFMNSDGGDAFEGDAIYNLLVAHPARVEVEVVGLCCSAASVIAMAADEIRMHANTWMMIHKAWGGVRGDDEDMHRWGDVLAKLSEQAVDVYAARTGLPKAEVAEMVAAETWMTAAEAKAKGFCDKVLPLKTAATKAKAQASASARGFACMSVDDYRNVPDAVRDAVKAARTGGAQPQQQHPIHPDPSGPVNDPGDDRRQEESTMNKKLIAQMLGISESATDESFETGIAALADERTKAKAEAATATTALSAAQAASKDLQARLDRFETALGAKGDAAFGVLEARMADRDKLDKANAALAEQAKQVDEQKRAALVKQGTEDGKLTPALVALYADKPVAELEAFVAAASRVVPEALTPPKGKGKSPASGAALTWNGKTYAELSNTERHELRFEDPELFAEMLAAASPVKAG